MNKRAEQMKYLKERLDSLSRAKNVFWNSEYVKLPKPLVVREAEFRIKRDEKIVARHERRERKATERLKVRKRTAFEACRKELFFGDPKKGLTMLDKFEREF